MLLLWCQRRRRSIARKSSTDGGRRPVLSATGLSAALVTVFLISVYMNLKRWNVLLIRDNNNDDFPRPDDGDGNNSKSSTIEGLRRIIPPPVHQKKKRNDINDHNNASSIPFMDPKPRLPETTDHLIRLSSKFDVKDLGIQLANQSAHVYKPGPWDGSGIVIEEFKLVFFTQGKVACTVFKQLFRRMMHIEEWLVDSSHLPHNPRKNGLTYLYHYRVADALTILTHPDWTRAIFVRDPKERTLSAFLDKAARKNGNYVKRHCCNGKESTCGEEANASFLGFLRVVEERCCCDPHWKPQTKRIDAAFRPFINFVGHFDRIQEDTKILLKRLNSNHEIDNDNGMDDDKNDPWITFGASGWGTHGNQSIFSKDVKAKHQTSAMTKFRQYYNSSSEALVEKLFADDYDDPLLNFTLFSLFENEKRQKP